MIRVKKCQSRYEAIHAVTARIKYLISRETVSTRVNPNMLWCKKNNNNETEIRLRRCMALQSVMIVIMQQEYARTSGRMYNGVPIIA